MPPSFEDIESLLTHSQDSVEYKYALESIRNAHRINSPPNHPPFLPTRPSIYMDASELFPQNQKPSFWFLEGLLNAETSSPRLNANFPTLTSAVRSRSPIGQLWPELLQRILYHTLDNPNMLRKPDQDRLASFRCVCRYWDSVALSFALVWRGLVVSSDKRLLHAKHLSPKVVAWLRRSGSITKRLSFASRVVYSTEDEKRSLLSLLAMYGNWERLDFNELSWSDLQTALTPSKYAAANVPCTFFYLRELSIYGHNKMAVRLFTGKSAPSSSLAAYSTLDRLHIKDATFTMDQLESLVAPRNPINLREVHLSNVRFLPASGEARPIVQPSVRLLSVAGVEVLRSLHCMTFPSLERLEVTDMGNDTVPFLIDFIKRCSSRLNALTIHGPTWHLDNIFTVFTSLSHCREMCLADAQVLKYVDVWAALFAIPGLERIVLVGEAVDGACHDICAIFPWPKIAWTLERRKQKRPDLPPFLIAHRGVGLTPTRCSDIVNSLVERRLIAFVEVSSTLSSK
jgi:hypothetical protein